MQNAEEHYHDRQGWSQNNDRVNYTIIFAETDLINNSMISITRATPADCETIVHIGKISVTAAHRDSCDAKDLDAFVDRNYNTEAIGTELIDENNIYHIIYCDGEPAGFSKIVLNAAHANIEQSNVTKLDRIYLLQKFFNRKLGHELLQFNIDLAKTNNQYGIWLYTWTGNERAVNFYKRNGFTIIGSHDFQVTQTRYNLNHHMLLEID